MFTSFDFFCRKQKHVSQKKVVSPRSDPVYKNIYTQNLYTYTDTYNSRGKMAKNEFFMKWPPWPSASATHRQTGWGLHQRRWSNDTCATPQRQLRHDLAWVWTDFLSEQRRATVLVETTGGAARAGGKRQPARCSRKTQDKFAIASMAKKLLYCCIGAHARVHMNCLRKVCMHFWQVLWASCMCRCVR